MFTQKSTGLNRVLCRERSNSFKSAGSWPKLTAPRSTRHGPAGTARSRCGRRGHGRVGRGGGRRPDRDWAETAIDKQALPGDERGRHAGQEGAGGGELSGAPGTAHRHLVDEALRGLAEIADALGHDRAGKQVVDRHIVPGDLARDAGHVASQRHAGGGRQIEPLDRHTDRHGGDVDDAAEAALRHARNDAADEFDGREQVGFQGLLPVGEAELREILGRRATGIGHEDIGIGTDLEHAAATVSR
jgi:hypothetical protein